MNTSTVSRETAARWASLVVRNVERYPAMGGMPSGHDRGVVIDESRIEPHIITDQPQHVVVFRGTLAECHQYVKALKSE